MTFLPGHSIFLLVSPCQFWEAVLIATMYHVIAVLLIIGLIFYCLPSIIAFSRQPPNAGSIYVINLLLGWTIWGWVTSLAMAVRTIPPGTRNPSKIYLAPVPIRARRAPAGQSAASFLPGVTSQNQGFEHVDQRDTTPPSLAVVENLQTLDLFLKRASESAKGDHGLWSVDFRQQL